MVNMKNCPHYLSIVGLSPTGEAIIYCENCESTWIAPIKANGVSIQLSDAGLSKGCKECQNYILKELDKLPNKISYKCPICNETWEVQRDNQSSRATPQS